ncbi:MAG: hypothetical protein RLY93_02145 [Sumerlaeia bacterium]
MTAAAPETTGFGRFLRRGRSRLLLWADADYRRAGWRLLAVGIKGHFGVRVLAALALLAVVGAWAAWNTVDSAADGYTLLLRLFGVAGLLGGATLYAADQRQGTFELLWLAMGSRRELLRGKAATLLFGLGLLMAPSVAVMSWFLYGNLPAVKAFLFLLSTVWFVIGLVALAGTFLPQAWAGGLLGAAAVGGLYAVLGDTTLIFNVFLNPMAGGAEPLAGGLLFWNRVVTVAFGFWLLNLASRRLGRALSA